MTRGDRWRDVWQLVKENTMNIFVGIFLVTGVVLTAVFGSILEVVMTGVRKIGQAVNNLGTKLAPSIPGILGMVASFTFDTERKVLGFLEKNLWLLVVAVVALKYDFLTKKTLDFFVEIILSLILKKSPLDIGWSGVARSFENSHPNTRKKF